MVDMDGCCPTELRGETGQVSLLRLGTHSISGSCCPIEVRQIEKPETVPEHAAHERKQPGEAVRPLADKGNVSEQNEQQQGGPQLPTDGLLGMPEKIADLEGLLDLLEKHLDAPAAAVEGADTGRGPVHVVGEENHDDPLAVDFHFGFDPAQPAGILPAGGGNLQGDLVIPQDRSLRLAQALAANMAAQVVFGARDPEYAAFAQMEKIGKMHVSLVKNRDLSGLQPRAQGQSPRVVVMGSFFNDGKAGKKTLQVEPQVHLRRGLAPTVLGPVHAVGHQGNGGGIDRMDRPFEATGQASVAPGRSKARRKLLQMPQHLPEQRLHHVAVALPIGMRKSVSARCNRSPDRPELGRMMPQGVADLVKADGMGQLRKEQTDHMTPWREGARLFIDPVLPGEFFRQMRRDEFTKLMQGAAVVFRRRYVFHTADSLVGIRRRPPFFNPARKGVSPHPVGCLWKGILNA